MGKYILPAIMSALSLCVGCKENPRSFIGQRIEFPTEGVAWKYFAADTTAAPRRDRPAIVIYYDSRGCISCRMKDLHHWRPILAQIRRDSVDVDIIPIFNVGKDNNDLLIALRSAGFDLPVMCDPEGGLEKNNRVPKDPLSQIFLLDRDNRITLMGTPVYNPEMWLAYMSKIKEATR